MGGTSAFKAVMKYEFFVKIFIQPLTEGAPCDKINKAKKLQEYNQNDGDKTGQITDLEKILRL
jgi:hypothetical protein